MNYMKEIPFLSATVKMKIEGAPIDSSTLSLEAGADPSLALPWAVENQTPRLVCYLLKYRPDLSRPERHSLRTVLIITTQIGNLEIMRLLVQAGADCLKQDGADHDALHHATISQCYEILCLPLRYASFAQGFHASGGSALEMGIRSSATSQERLAAQMCF